MTFTRKQFIEKIAPYAIKDMKESHVPASLTIAQAILESGNGNSSLTVQANNLFGIKGTGTAGTIVMKTQEQLDNGKFITIEANFRKYHNWGESVADHSGLFINGVSWNRKLYHGAIGVDGITAAHAVAKAGYATDKKYAEKLINLINENNLLQYDTMEVEEPANEPIIRLIELVDRLHERLSTVETKLLEIPAPDWLVKEFPQALDLINQKTGSLEFWRGYAITLRALSQYNSNFVEIGLK